MGQAVSCLIAMAIIALILAFDEPYVIVDVKNDKYIKALTIPPYGSYNIIKEENNTRATSKNISADSNYTTAGAVYYAGSILIGGFFEENNGRDYFMFGEAHGGMADGIRDNEDSIIIAPEWPLADKDSPFGKYSFDLCFSDRQISPPKENRPLMINFTKPVYPRGLRFKVDAVVTLRFLLKANGTIEHFDIIDEEPPGYGFALAVKEALRDSWIRPAVVDGIKTGGYYILIYEFCERCPSKPVVVQSGSNVSVTIR